MCIRDSPKVKLLQYTGKVGKCTSYWCQIFSGFYAPKIIKIGYIFWQRYLKNKQVDVFGDTVYIPFDFQLCVTIGMSFCIGLPNFMRIVPYAAELWRHSAFSKWRPPHRNSTSGFLVNDCLFRKVESYPQSKFLQDFSVRCWDINTLCLNNGAHTLCLIALRKIEHYKQNFAQLITHQYFTICHKIIKFEELIMCAVIIYAKLDHVPNDRRYNRKIGNWLVVWNIILIQTGFTESRSDDGMLKLRADFSVYSAFSRFILS